jgi:hypothetical protein
VLNQPFRSNHGPTATPHTPPQSTPCATDIRLSPLVHYQDPSRDRDKLFTLQSKCGREHTALARWRAVAQDCFPFQQFNLNAASRTTASRPQKELEIGERAPNFGGAPGAKDKRSVTEITASGKRNEKRCPERGPFQYLPANAVRKDLNLPSKIEL